MQIQASFSTTQKTESIFPSDALEILPFSEEPISGWTENSDISKFLYHLYAGTGYEECTEYKLSELCENFESFANSFHQQAASAQPSPASINQTLNIPQFEKCEKFGLVAKSMGAWDNVISNMLSESNFFSLPHLLETRTDLASSIYLAQNLFYRQAFQVLRGFLESVVLPIFFCANPEKYSEWKSDEFHSPSMRGKKGVLRILVKEGIISADLSEQVSNLYGNLNQYIHGSESSLNNTGIPTGTWEGFVFRTGEYNKWALVFAKSVEVCIYLMRLHHVQWTALENANGTMCRVCHSQEFEIIPKNGMNEYDQYKCKSCGNSFHLNEENKRVVITTIETQEES